MQKRLSGFELEDWVKAFAKKNGILNESPFKAEQTIKLFNQKLNQRLKSARARIDNYFIEGERWIDAVVSNRSLTGLSGQIKTDFANRLADLVMGTDLVVKVKNSTGQDIQIAIDVTSNDLAVEEKLKKVKGQSPTEGFSKANKNIPEVRSELGIDKHLILLLNSTTTLLPSHATLLNTIYAFAESPTVTRAADLSNLEAKDRYNWRVEYEADPERMWKKYTQAFNAKSTAVLGLEVAKHALRENHAPKAVLNMLTQDPQYREYLRRDGGDRSRADQHAQGILAKAQAELEQFRVKDANQIADGINRVLAKFGKEQADGSLVFEGNTLRFTASPSEMTVQNIQSGAVTFHIKNGQLLKHNVNSDLKSRVNALKKVMDQPLQVEPNINKRTSLRKGR